MEPIFSPTLAHQLKVLNDREKQRIKERQARDYNCSVGRRMPVPDVRAAVLAGCENESLAIAEGIGRCIPGQLCQPCGHGSIEWCAECNKTSLS